ncbi:MAG TPA: HEPN domain-containing protein [Thermofilum sp.]|nr:HEPN domain-containing protein [Thermofilum sp.]
MDVSRIEEYKVLIRRSHEFLTEAEEALRSNRYDLACFFAEQAVQLFLKATLLKLVGDYPRTHYVRVLISKLVEVLPEDRARVIKNFVRDNRARLSELEDAYLMSRYTVKVYSRSDSRDMVDLAKEVMDLIRRVVSD